MKCCGRTLKLLFLWRCEIGREEEWKELNFWGLITVLGMKEPVPFSAFCISLSWLVHITYGSNV